MAGYSGTPLPKKLGIKPGHRVALVDAPADFDLGELPEEVDLRKDLRKKDLLDVILLFVKDAAALAAKLEKTKDKLQKNGGLWICWPKRASGIATDLSENLLREVILPTGLVDNKVCAVDDTWSGLRFVYRLEHR